LPDVASCTIPNSCQWWMISQAFATGDDSLQNGIRMSAGRDNIVTS